LDVSNPILIIVTGRLLLVVVANNRSLAQLMPSGAVHPNTGMSETRRFRPFARTPSTGSSRP